MSSPNERMLIDLTQELASIPAARRQSIGGSSSERVFPSLTPALWRFRLTILWTTIIGFGGGLGYFSVSPLLYQSSALVSLGHDSGSRGNGPQVEAERLGYPALNDEVKVALVRSSSLAERILERNPNFISLVGQSGALSLGDRGLNSNISPKPGAALSRADISGYLDRISYRHSEGSPLIEIFAIAPDPSTAAKIANSHSQGLIDLLHEKRVNQAEALLAKNQIREEETRNNYLALVERERAIADELSRSSPEQAEYSKLQAELQIVKKESELAKASWEASIKKLSDAQQSIKEEIKGLAIIDPAVPPISPLSLSLLALMSIGGLCGGLAGTLLALIRQARDSSLHSIIGCASQIGRPVIGMIPSISPETKTATSLMASRSLSFAGDRISESSTPITSWFRYQAKSTRPKAPFLLAAPFSAESEAVRAMAASLVQRSIHPTQNILLFTSPGAREGKSLLAVNTSVALAQMHKRILLVDADLRFPSIHKFFGLHRESIGLFDFALGTMEINELIVQSSTEGLMLLLSGSPAPLPTLINDHERIESGLRSLSPLYDAIILDSPAIGSVADPLLLSRIAHSVVLVTRYNQTTLQETQIALDHLDRAQANVVGIALNDIKDDTLIRYLNN